MLAEFIPQLTMIIILDGFIFKSIERLPGNLLALNNYRALWQNGFINFF
jgi:hypothetical protein